MTRFGDERKKWEKKGEIIMPVKSTLKERARELI